MGDYSAREVKNRVLWRGSGDFVSMSNDRKPVILKRCLEFDESGKLVRR